MTRWRAILAAALTHLLAATSGWADDIPPIQVQIQEREPGSFLVQWRVPKVLAAQAIPTPVMPEGAQAEGERAVVDQPSTWLFRQIYRCPDGLEGETLGIRYPIANPSLTTIFRVQLLSGEQYARALSPLEDSWRLPEASAGVWRRWLRGVRAALVSGVRHVFDFGVHLAFLGVVVLLGGAIRLVTAFAIGQLLAIACTALLGRAFDATSAEICVAIAVVFLALEVFRPAADRRRLAGISAVAGVFHALALSTSRSHGFAGSEVLAFVLGMDTILLLLALAGTTVLRLLLQRVASDALLRWLTYGLGGYAVGSGLILAWNPPIAEATETEPRERPLVSAPSSLGLPGSRRVAPPTLDAALQSHLTVEPFEVRHEVLVRVRDVAAELELGEVAHVEVEAQEEVIRRVGTLVRSRSSIEIDGQPREGTLDRASFMTADAMGVLPRQEKVRELAGEALVGVTMVYSTNGMAQGLELRWQGVFDTAPTIPATIIDPESSRSTTLTAENPTLRWKNELIENPIPTLNALAVEPQRVPLPTFSLALLFAALALLVAAWRGRRRALPFAASRVVLAGAVLALPLAQVAVAIPGFLEGTISTDQARRVLAGVLPNVYRALELRDEDAAYDRLAVAVTGPTLTDVYLQHRQALEMEDRGGARARVEAVQVTSVDAIEAREDGGFEANASWTVAGTVTHFGHRHLRENRYDSRVVLVPAEGAWKILSIEVLDRRRLR